MYIILLITLVTIEARSLMLWLCTALDLARTESKIKPRNINTSPVYVRMCTPANYHKYVCLIHFCLQFIKAVLIFKIWL